MEEEEEVLSFPDSSSLVVTAAVAVAATASSSSQESCFVSIFATSHNFPLSVPSPKLFPSSKAALFRGGEVKRTFSPIIFFFLHCIIGVEDELELQ